MSQTEQLISEIFKSLAKKLTIKFEQLDLFGQLSTEGMV